MTTPTFLRAVEGPDRWENLEFDAVTRHLAEKAATTAALSVDEWIERAIRRACPNTITAVAATAAPPIETPPVEAPAAPADTAAVTPPPPAAPAESDIEEPLPASLIEAVRPDIAEGFGTEIEAADANRSEEVVVEGAEGAKAEVATIETPAADDDIDDSELDVGPPPHNLRWEISRWAMMAIGVALAVTGGVMSAQYLLPDRSSTIRIALAPVPAPSTAVSPPAQEAQATAPSETRLNEFTAAPAAPAGAASSPAPTSPAPAAADAAPAAKPAPESAATTAAPAPPPAASDNRDAAARKMALAKPNLPKATPGAKSPEHAGKSDEPPSDPRQLASWLEARVKTGDAVAQYRLGVLYALGDGVTQDYERAAALFKAAADEGIAEAQYNLAVMYGEGLGIGREPNKAIFWYRKAAAQGSASAAFNLGVAYSNGAGVPQSMEQAAQWFRHAAEAGVVNAQFNIGLLYERGEGVKASPVEAYAWYSAAAAHGDSGAAQRRDRLANTLDPAVLKEAQARAEKIEAAVPSSASGTSVPIGISRKP